MQFGHNDGGRLDGAIAMAALRLKATATKRKTSKTDGKTETVHSFGWYLRRYISDAKAKGATPIVLSLIPRNDWKDGKVIARNHRLRRVGPKTPRNRKSGVS